MDAAGCCSLVNNGYTPNVGLIIGQMYHYLDNLDLYLPFGGAVQDLCITDPTQEMCPRSYRL